MGDLFYVFVGLGGFGLLALYVIGCGEGVMGFDYVVGAAGAVIVLIYLVIALLRPEKF